MLRIRFLTLFLLISVLLNYRSLGVNGGNVLGVTAASIGLGGTGMANFLNGTEAMYRNPALLTAGDLKEGQFSFEFNSSLIKQNAKATYTDFNLAESADRPNKAGPPLIPAMGMTYRFSDKMTVGIGVMGASGANSDYTDEPVIGAQKFESSIARTTPSVAYRVLDNLSVGGGPVIGYGQMALNEGLTGPGGNIPSTRAPHSSLALGFQLGVSYAPLPELTFGAAYDSKTAFKYENLTDVEAFRLAADGLDAIQVEQPQEIAVGVGYKVTPAIRLSADYRHIGWGNADGFSTFDWKSQHVIALGTEYRMDAWAFRLGFNYASSPIKNESNQSGDTNSDLQGHQVSAATVSSLNIHSFNAISSTHFTVGTGYQLTPDIDLDFAFMYSPKTTITRSGNHTVVNASVGITTPTNVPYSYATTISQWSVTLGGTVRL